MVAEPASDTTRVPAGAGLRVQDQRSVERLDRGVDRARAGSCDAEILERGGARERSRPGREQVDRTLEVVDVGL